MSKRRSSIWIRTSPIANTLLVWALALAAVLLIGARLQYYNQQAFWISFVAGLHNTVVDILLIGVFIFWLNKQYETRLEIQRHRETIDIWRSDGSDATVRKNQLGIKRLNDCGVSDIDLSGTTLDHCDLSMSLLSKSNFSGAKCYETCFDDADLRETNFDKASLKHSSLRRANLDGATLRRANLMYADLQEATLRSADLCGANLSNASLSGAIYNSATKFPEGVNKHGMVFESRSHRDWFDRLKVGKKGA